MLHLFFPVLVKRCKAPLVQAPHDFISLLGSKMSAPHVKAQCKPFISLLRRKFQLMSDFTPSHFLLQMDGIFRQSVQRVELDLIPAVSQHVE